jgi:hypothetical protein
MPHWEYQVIRLNIEPPAIAESQESAGPRSAGSDASTSKADASNQPGAKVFSDTYLKEEFPRFYDSSLQAQHAAGQAQQADPAFQLQDFLNAQGQQGWELVGFQHAPPHVFIVFKRPAAGQESVQAAQSEQLRLTLDLANRALAIIEKQAG